MIALLPDDPRAMLMSESIEGVHLGATLDEDSVGLMGHAPLVDCLRGQLVSTVLMKQSAALLLATIRFSDADPEATDD